MRDKRGMRDKGLPENTRTKRTMRTKVLAVRLRNLGSASGRVDQTLACRVAAWCGDRNRPLFISAMRTKSPGRLMTGWMARWRDWRAIWIGSVLSVDTSYRCEIEQLCRVSDSYFFEAVRYEG